MQNNLPKHVEISKEILFQQLDDESIMLNLHDEYYYSLDDVGTRLWQLFSEHSNTESVIAQMLTEYSVDEASLRQDVAHFIEQLSAAEVISITA